MCSGGAGTGAVAGAGGEIDDCETVLRYFLRICGVSATTVFVSSEELSRDPAADDASPANPWAASGELALPLVAAVLDVMSAAVSADCAGGVVLREVKGDVNFAQSLCTGPSCGCDAGPLLLLLLASSPALLPGNAAPALVMAAVVVASRFSKTLPLSWRLDCVMGEVGRSRDLCAVLLMVMLVLLLPFSVSGRRTPLLDTAGFVLNARLAPFPSSSSSLSLGSAGSRDKDATPAVARRREDGDDDGSLPLLPSRAGVRDTDTLFPTEDPGEEKAEEYDWPPGEDSDADPFRTPVPEASSGRRYWRYVCPEFFLFLCTAMCVAVAAADCVGVGTEDEGEELLGCLRAAAVDCVGVGTEDGREALLG